MLLLLLLLRQLNALTPFLRGSGGGGKGAPHKICRARVNSIELVCVRVREPIPRSATVVALIRSATDLRVRACVRTPTLFRYKFRSEFMPAHVSREYD